MVIRGLEITEYNQSPGYVVGDFKLIFKNTYDNEDNESPMRKRQVTKNANDQSVSKEFYYVHIEVDLDSVNKCTCSKIICECQRTQNR